MTEDLDTGARALTDFPQEWQPTLTTYQQTLTDAGITINPNAVELVVALDQYRIAGTVDRIVTMPDGTHRIADLKTSKNVNYSGLEFGIQLAIYANHDATYNYGTMTRGPRVDVDRATGLVIHLPSKGPEAGKCVLYDVDLTAGYEALLTALEVREHRTASKQWLTIHTPKGPEPTEREWVAERIAALPAAAVRDLRNRWPEEVPQPVPDEPTAAQVDALVAVLNRVEARHEIPFGNPRPGTTTNQKANT